MSCSRTRCRVRASSHFENEKLGEQRRRSAHLSLQLHARSRTHVLAARNARQDLALLDVRFDVTRNVLEPHVLTMPHAGSLEAAERARTLGIGHAHRRLDFTKVLGQGTSTAAAVTLRLLRWLLPRGPRFGLRGRLQLYGRVVRCGLVQPKRGRGILVHLCFRRARSRHWRRVRNLTLCVGRPIEVQVRLLELVRVELLAGLSKLESLREPLAHLHAL
jgi:hypothetical protein